MSIAAGCRAEIERLARRRFDLALLTIVPAILLASMAAMIWPGSLNGLRVIVVDRDGGAVARSMIRTINSTPRLKLVEITGQIGPALSAVRREQAQAVIVIEAGIPREEMKEIAHRAAPKAQGPPAQPIVYLNDSRREIMRFDIPRIRTAACTGCAVSHGTHRPPARGPRGRAP